MGEVSHYIKDNLFSTPAVFQAIQKASKTSWKEMYKVFNMGHRMELYCEENDAKHIISIAKNFGIEAKIVGFTEKSKKADSCNHMSLHHRKSTVFEY